MKKNCQESKLFCKVLTRNKFCFFGQCSAPSSHELTCKSGQVTHVISLLFPRYILAYFNFSNEEVLSQHTVKTSQATSATAQVFIPTQSYTHTHTQRNVHTECGTETDQLSSIKPSGGVGVETDDVFTSCMRCECEATLCSVCLFKTIRIHFNTPEQTKMYLIHKAVKISLSGPFQKCWHRSELHVCWSSKCCVIITVTKLMGVFITTCQQIQAFTEMKVLSLLAISNDKHEKHHPVTWMLPLY